MRMSAAIDVLSLLTQQTHLAAPRRWVIPHLLHHLVHCLATVHRVEYHACSWGASSHVRKSSHCFPGNKAWQVILGTEQAHEEGTTIL